MVVLFMLCSLWIALQFKKQQTLASASNLMVGSGIGIGRPEQNFGGSFELALNVDQPDTSPDGVGVGASMMNNDLRNHRNYLNIVQW